MGSCARALVPVTAATAIKQALASRVMGGRRGRRGTEVSPTVTETALRLHLATSQTAIETTGHSCNDPLGLIPAV